MDKVLLKSMVPRLGRLLKSFRDKTGQNQADIALKAEISVSMLSQIERGVVSPSIETLIMVSTALGVEVADLFKMVALDRPVRIHHTGERLWTQRGGVRYEQLMTSDYGAYQAELFLLEVEPGLSTAFSGGAHEGVEIGYVLMGTAVVTIDSVEYPVREGDSVYFNAQLPHQLRNNGEISFKAVWSISPPHVDFLAFEEV